MPTAPSSFILCVRALWTSSRSCWSAPWRLRRGGWFGSARRC